MPQASKLLVLPYSLLYVEYQPIHARFIVNAAGLHAGHMAALVGAANFTIEPRRGEYLVLAKSEGARVRHVLFQVPTERGKGILVSPTFHGNLVF